MPIIPHHIFGDGQDISQHPRNNNPIGSGPFKLAEFDPGSHIRMVRNKDFFMPHGPYLDEVIFKVYESPAKLLRGLERGEIDIHTQLASAPDIQRARKMKNVMVQADAAPAVGPLVWLAFNTQNPKLNDKRVRQAINYAIDKDFIAKTLLGDVHKRATGPIHSSSPFYKAKVNTYALNLKKAAALLDEAGKTPDENGVRMTLKVDSIPGVSEMKTVQQYLVPALAKIGIEVTMHESPDFRSWAKRVSRHEFEVTVDSVWNWGDPVIGVHRSWLSSNIREGVIWSNTQSYRNEKVDQLLTDAGRKRSVAARKTAYHEVQDLIVDDCPVAFLYELTFHYGINKRVSSPPRSVWGMMSPIDQLYLKPQDAKPAKRDRSKNKTT